MRALILHEVNFSAGVGIAAKIAAMGLMIAA